MTRGLRGGERRNDSGLPADFVHDPPIHIGEHCLGKVVAAGIDPHGKRRTGGMKKAERAIGVGRLLEHARPPATEQHRQATDVGELREQRLFQRKRSAQRDNAGEFPRVTEPPSPCPTKKIRFGWMAIRSRTRSIERQTASSRSAAGDSLGPITGCTATKLRRLTRCMTRPSSKALFRVESSGDSGSQTSSG